MKGKAPKFFFAWVGFVSSRIRTFGILRFLTRWNKPLTAKAAAKCFCFQPFHQNLQPHELDVHATQID